MDHRARSALQLGVLKGLEEPSGEDSGVSTTAVVDGQRHRCVRGPCGGHHCADGGRSHHGVIEGEPGHVAGASGKTLEYQPK